MKKDFNFSDFLGHLDLIYKHVRDFETYVYPRQFEKVKNNPFEIQNKPVKYIKDDIYVIYVRKEDKIVAKYASKAQFLIDLKLQRGLDIKKVKLPKPYILDYTIGVKGRKTEYNSIVINETEFRTFLDTCYKLLEEYGFEID